MKEIKAGRPEQAFVSDITYIKSGQQVHYLSLVTDACSRKIMELYLSDDMRTEHVVIALKRTVKEGKTSQELIRHSDRGLQYCSSLAIKTNSIDSKSVLP